MPLPREHLLEELATAYVQIVAAMGGATISVSRRDYGVDGTLNRIVRAGRSRGPGDKFVPDGFSVEFQLKGTSAAMPDADFLPYDLNARNYDLIVGRSPIATPLYLFVVCFGSNASDWVAVERSQLILGASAFWWMQTTAPTDNASTVRIRIPVTNRLTGIAIDSMLEASRNRLGHD
jgi:hypothetical protein